MLLRPARPCASRYTHDHPAREPRRECPQRAMECCYHDLNCLHIPGDRDERQELLGGPQAWPLLLASCPVPGVLQLLHCLIIDYGNTEACLAGDFGSPSYR